MQKIETQEEQSRKKMQETYNVNLREVLDHFIGCDGGKLSESQQ